MPEVESDLQFFVQAFTVLDRARGNNGFGELPITVSDMLAYCQMFGIDEQEDREEFLIIIMSMDAELLKYRGEKAKQAAASKRPASHHPTSHPPSRGRR